MTNSYLLLVLFTACNLIYYSHGQYRGTPQNVADIKGILKHSVVLKCEYDGDDGQFIEWFKDGVRIRDEKPNHYVVKQNEKESILTIKIFVKADSEVKKWYVTTKTEGEQGPTACQFGQIGLIPSPQGIRTNQEKEVLDTSHESIRRNEDESLRLNCSIAPEPTSPVTVVWKYSKDDSDYEQLPDGVEVENNDIKIGAVKKTHRGYYRCVLNDVSFTVLLRVKDRLAALWPFLGIVGVVVVLVVIILIFENRQKSNRKSAATDDDEQDANDPLVRTTTTKGSDNDSKKRAVKA